MEDITQILSLAIGLFSGSMLIIILTCNLND